jgi:hypothetical protein
MCIHCATSPLPPHIHFWKTLLLVYYSGTGVSLWHFHMCLQCIFTRFIPTIVLPYPLPLS